MILKATNEARARQGYELVPNSALRLRRQIVKPFVEEVLKSTGDDRQFA
jgi:hypothetical protein